MSSATRSPWPTFVRARVDQWEAAGDITARTAQRYRQLVENQIVPHLGRKPLQKLTRLDVEGWHTTSRNGGLAARTIGHAHRVLRRRSATRNATALVVKNVCKLQRAPKVAESEMVIVQDVPGFVAARIRSERLTFRPSWRCSPACGLARCWRCGSAR